MSLLLRRTASAVQRAQYTHSELLGAHLLPQRSLRLRLSSSKSRQDPAGKSEEPPQLPKFSLDGLGATPAIKVAIYTAIGIMGTVETYTYGLWIYHKFYPKPIVDGESRSGAS